MCIEVYHPRIPLVIPYESEVLRFTSPTSFTAEYTLLIRNVGNEPITTLNALCPRRLYAERSSGQWVLQGIRDTTEHIPDVLGDCDARGSVLRFTQRDPNRPQYDRAVLEGTWLPGTARISVPENTFSVPAISFLEKAHNSFFQVQLHKELAPLESRWFRWQVDVDDVGIVTDTPAGKAVVHQIISPQRVAERFDQILESAHTASVRTGLDWLPSVLEKLKQDLGVRAKRQVEIELFELALLPGPSKERFLLSWTADGDIRMQSGGPRREEGPGEPEGEWVYEWKSGSLLRPPSGSSGGEGFVLNFTFLITPGAPLQVDWEGKPPPPPYESSEIKTPQAPQAELSEEEIEKIVERALQRLGEQANLQIVQEMHVENQTNIHGDVVGSAIGDRANVNARDVNVYKQTIDAAALDEELKRALSQARSAIENLSTNHVDRADVADDLGKLTDEVIKTEPDIGRVRRFWNRIRESAPTVATILKSAESIRKLLMD